MTNRIKQTLFSITASLFVTMLLATISFAQNATVHGQVVDELKAVIPGADIVLTSPDGKQRKAKSAVSGEFSIANVPPGVYTLTCSFQGFQTVVMNDVKIPLEKPSLEITMIVGTIDVVTDVSANTVGVSTNPDENMSATVLSEEFIKGLPDNEDDMRNIVTGKQIGRAHV